ncbi:luciferase [Halobacteria archaeon AArc-m2/3/4]|uniref:Luciferase n=1 Tax=Natronoglomus mannanivorans TaxID=2979990 RepID=A0AAP3E1U7_9EURY|nr:luciferase [Halobacteria archaeon AArc-xg1-1]MCU4975122.1 luciferase [Halobacteria archaeon AArc-m2/3/4]
MSTRTHRHPPLRSRIGLDAIAIKPAECDVSRVTDTPVDTLAIDYEGREHLPDAETLTALTAESNTAVRLTTPVRADGFDPLGDDSLLESLPDGVGRVLVAGHPAYLSSEEQRRAIAPRLGAALESAPDAWVGTESVERIAMATGATQYDLLTRSTERTLHALRTAGFDGDIAVYAPTVLTDDPDAVLDAVGGYVARRRPVAEALPDPEEATDSSATGRTREVLLEAASDYALVGTESAVRERIDELRTAGATTVVGYPARGLDELLE